MSPTNEQLEKWEQQVTTASCFDGDWPSRARILIAEVKRLRKKCDDLTVSGFQAKLKQLDEARAEVERLRAELDAVLSDWNAIVKASGSPTNGAAIGHVAAMRAEVERLRPLLEEREIVRRLRADLEYERQLHRDAAAEVKRLRAALSGEVTS